MVGCEMLREWCPLVLLTVKFYTNVQWKNRAPLLVQQSRDTPLMGDLCSGLTWWGRQPGFPKDGKRGSVCVLFCSEEDKEL